MNTSVHITDDITNKAHTDHLLLLLEDPIDNEARAKASTYYPEGSLLAMLPSDADLEKARTAVIEEACKTDFANLVPLNSTLRPIFEQKDALHQAFLNEAVDNINTYAREIGQELLNGAQPAHILALNAEGADAHNGAQHTMVVTTDVGTFLYKPRSLKPDVVIKALCDDLFPGIFYVPRAIDCGAFGFSEFIENVDPIGIDELNGYFTSLGTFCALSHFLSLSDQHTENFLARGAQLVPIDLETMLASTFKWTRHGYKSTMLTPIWQGSAGSDSFANDMGRSITSTLMLSCKFNNLYGAILAGTSHKIEPISTCHEALDYKKQIVAGFEQGYKTCLENKTRICEAIQDLRGTRLRVILESTMLYHLLLKRLFNVSIWETVDNVEAMEHAVKQALRSTTHVKFNEPVLDSEIKSILRGDYPAFYFVPESRVLYDGNSIVDDDYLGESPLSIALERLDCFDENDLQFQSRVLAKAIEDMPLMTQTKPISLEVPSDSLAPNDAKAEAAHILALTYHDIVQGNDSQGGLWATSYGETYRSTMSCDLSTGYAGVGIFAAACLATHTGNARHAKTLLDICLHELNCHVKAMQSQPDQFARWGVGLADGTGGIIRALQLIWGYTKDKRIPSIYDAVLRTTEAADLTTAPGNNIYNGLAGLLLPLASDTPGLTKSTSVEKIADTLLCRATTDKDRHRVWIEQDGISGEIGYGKGTGGIGLAFLRAWQATGCRRFWDACCDALAYEDAAYDPNLGFWPLKAQAKKKNKLSPPGICRGVPGQAIVFTQTAQAGVPLAQRNVERARPCALALPPECNDNLCCGTSAIVDGLLTLGYQEEPGRLLHAQVNRRKQLGNYITEDTKRAPYFNPNLFYGCLGVGYELLRYANPETITSIFT